MLIFNKAYRSIRAVLATIGYEKICTELVPCIFIPYKYGSYINMAIHNCFWYSLTDNIINLIHLYDE